MLMFNGKLQVFSNLQSHDDADLSLIIKDATGNQLNQLAFKRVLSFEAKMSMLLRLISDNPDGALKLVNSIHFIVNLNACSFVDHLANFFVSSQQHPFLSS
eukprot:CAMPEP_0184361208 /NCGR_PEP_ID=MMETSP1089-20130417/129046_1 /TAXON_ID=38269 ORGANISM="Gloeochaete wittrockiana, Strain SAG46.84" /NCGR_SAMPLE_ID=MMETSP1089 /ASSEMBLY_ACC=CAM_ASM_000445 /LENGTH=100 /DNA_ID=CAMNT_0026700763 /DNA_START=12 /DNA_END=310 /DNA_ORIENTATION=-